MPAAVAIPLITAGIGAGTSLYAQKKQNDAAAAAAAQSSVATPPSAATSGGSDGGSSSSGGSHSYSHGGTVFDQGIRDSAFNASNSFLSDGGLSEGDVGNLRARAATPIRAAYANAEREIGRNRALQGGYSPNANAALARMAREQGQATADAGQNAEAGIAQMRQQGKMAGLSAITSMYGNMPTFNESTSDSWNGSSSGGGSGSGEAAAGTPPIQQKQGLWSKIGSGLKAVGRVALPIALNHVGQPKQPQIGAGMPPIQQIPRTNNFPSGPLVPTGTSIDGYL